MRKIKGHINEKSDVCCFCAALPDKAEGSSY